MIKGVDYTGITVSFLCHDGEGNYVMHKRGINCRDEHGVWDFGGGGLKFGETLKDALIREVVEEYGTPPLSVEYLGFDEIFREHESKPTHWIGFRYKVLLDRSKVINGEPQKHDEIGWFTLDTLPQPLHSQLQSTIEKYRGRL
jgi:8-oxo-dGTP diphosphatase